MFVSITSLTKEISVDFHKGVSIFNHLNLGTCFFYVGQIYVTVVYVVEI